MTDFVGAGVVVDRANATLATGFDAIFDDLHSGTWQLFTEDIGAVDGMTVDIVFTDDLGQIRKGIPGESRAQEGGRWYSASYPVENFYRTLSLPRLNFQQDRSGQIGRSISRFLQSLPGFVNAKVWEKLKTNPTGPDGVALLSTAHPFGPDGATQSNKTTDALAKTSFRAGIAAMRKFRRENGLYLNPRPTHLIVNPDDEGLALELTQADLRYVPINASGVEAAAAVVATAAIDNVYAGRIQVVLEPEITSGDWLIVAAGGAARPWAIGFARQLEQFPFDMESEERRQRDMLSALVDGDWGQGPANWQTVYGKLS